MRIAIDIRPMLEAQRCGVATYTSEITKRLCNDTRHEYTLFCNARRRPLPQDIPPSNKSVSHRFFRYPNRLFNTSLAMFNFPKLEHLVPKVNAVYLPNLNFIATSLPTIVTVHDLSFVRYPHFFSKKQRTWHKIIQPKKLIKNAHALIAVSSHTKDDIIEIYGIPPERITIANPAVDERFFNVANDIIQATRKKYLLTKPYILYLGALEPRKNIPTIIAAFEKITSLNIDLVIAGGKGWLYKDIFARAAQSPARNRIHFLGYVPDEQKPGLYAGAEVFVYPSFYEGFGMPPLEAMATGTPVIASATSSLGEVVGGAGILINPFDVEDCSHGIITILSDKNIHATLSKRGIKKAREYDWETTVQRIQNVFDTLQ